MNQIKPASKSLKTLTLTLLSSYKQKSDVSLNKYYPNCKVMVHSLSNIHHRGTSIKMKVSTRAKCAFQPNTGEATHTHSKARHKYSCKLKIIWYTGWWITDDPTLTIKTCNKGIQIHIGWTKLGTNNCNVWEHILNC